MNPNYLDFEQPIAELEVKIEELQLVGSDAEINITEEISRLKEKSEALTKSIFSNLSAWQIAQLARGQHAAHRRHPPHVVGRRALHGEPRVPPAR